MKFRANSFLARKPSVRPRTPQFSRKTPVFARDPSNPRKQAFEAGLQVFRGPWRPTDCPRSVSAMSAIFGAYCMLLRRPVRMEQKALPGVAREGFKGREWIDLHGTPPGWCRPPQCVSGRPIPFPAANHLDWISSTMRIASFRQSESPECRRSSMIWHASDRSAASDFLPPSL